MVALVQPMTQNAAMRTDLANFASKQDLADLRLEMAERDVRIYRWLVYGALFVNAALIAIFVKLLSRRARIGLRARGTRPPQARDADLDVGPSLPLGTLAGGAIQPDNGPRCRSDGSSSGFLI